MCVEHEIKCLACRGFLLKGWGSPITLPHCLEPRIPHSLLLPPFNGVFRFLCRLGKLGCDTNLTSGNCKKTLSRDTVQPQPVKIPEADGPWNRTHERLGSI